jgi:hypothetical protein
MQGEPPSPGRAPSPSPQVAEKRPMCGMWSTWFWAYVEHSETINVPRWNLSAGLEPSQMAR